MKVRTDAKRDEIVEIARKTFLELGYERASMAEIANRLGGSKATLIWLLPVQGGAVPGHREQAGRAICVAGGPAPGGERRRKMCARPYSASASSSFAFISDPEAVAAYRVVVSEAAHSDIGGRFMRRGRSARIEVHRGAISLAPWIESNCASRRSRDHRSTSDGAARAWRAVASIFLT